MQRINYCLLGIKLGRIHSYDQHIPILLVKWVTNFQVYSRIALKNETDPSWHLPQSLT